ncbi:MAG: hypothetical protein GY796_01450, partial [Chloroflexi bacterium]|nr:hypothetical protein [Chloroflexota bacterium]
MKIPPDAPNALTAYALADNGFLFVTVDGGASWNLHSTAPEGFDRRNLALAADFTVSPTMYIAAEHWSWGIYGDNPGVFKSTDGGITWTQMNNGLSDDHVRYVAVSPDMAEKDTLFALTHSGLEKSTDGGANWTAVTTIPDANELSGIVLSPNYASDQTVFVTAHTGRVYISNDGGSSWTGVDSLRGDPRYPAFSPDFASDNTLCHGGGWNDWFYCSNDSGATWWESSTGLPGHLRDEGTGILFSPNFSGDTTVFVASIGGMARSLDSGATWETLRDLNNIGNGDGVQINNGASHNHILDNIIGNNFQGVSIHDTDTAYNIVAGNLIGTDAAGAAPLSNASHGIGLSDGHDNLIGGPGAGDGNLVSGNMEFGIGMWNTATVSNTIQGNIIGTDASGSYAISNRDAGIHLNGPNHNYILDNLVSGNGQNGIDLCCTGTEYNVISGNFVGTDASGTAVIPNRHTGVSLGSGSSYNLIGGSTAAERNLISGNGDNGVGIGNSDTMSNTVSGNYIGTDVTGTGMLGNGQNSDGIHIHNGAAYNIIGGATAAEGNLISGNYRVGVSINGEDNGTNRNVVQNNYIGTDASGMNALGNGVGEQYTAVELYYTDNNLIKDNLISGNNSNGIYIQGDTAFGNLIEGNLIGTDATGTQPLFRLDVEESEESEANQSARCTPMETAPEGFDERLLEDRKCTAAANPQTETDITVLTSNNGAGIVLEHGSHLNTIGLSNIIAFNNDHGVIVDGFNTLSNTISQNSIFHNNGIGINLRNGGNSQLAAPSVMGINLATGVVTGTACANCTVEVFSDDADEGRIFEGTTTANGAGDFAFNKGSALAGPNITATATDAAGNTSPFSALFEILWVNLGLDHTQWALQRLGLSYTPVDVTDIGTVTLSDYDVILVGSTADWVPDDVYQPLLNHKSAIDAYVQGGGTLVALSNGGDWNQYATSLDWSWVPVDLTWYGQTRRTHILTPTHPLAEGLTDTDFFYWWGAHGEAFTSWNWPGAESVVWASADGRSALLAGSYGAGQMILSGMFPDVDDQGDTTLNAMLHWATGHWPDHSPLVTRATPDPDGLGATNTRLRLRFDQLLDPATVTPGVLTVVADSGTVVGSFTYLPDISEIFFTPAAPLTPGEMVTATLSAAVTDWQGNPLDGDGDGTGGDDFTWRFVVNSGAVLMVDNSANDGSGTLREAMQLSLPGDTIRFDAAVFPPATPTTISLDWNLDDMTAGYVTIDAANTGVVLDADNADWVGLSIRSDGNVVQGLTIINGRGNNIYIGDGAAYNLIGGNRNSGAGPNGEGNTISYGHEWGIFVQGGGTISNTFLGNHVGVDPTGTAAWPNGLDWGASGLFIEQGADYTVIGSNVPGERNVLSGNNGDGLDINESYYVTVLNNYLGTDASGMNPVPNNQCGLDLQAGSRYVYLEDNLFSGNNSCGAQVDDPGTDYNEFVNNQFGLDAAGTTPLPNHRYGLYVLDFVEQTLITGNTFANDLLGINIFGSSRNTVVDNYIGTDASGTAVFGHSMAGIWVDTWDFGSVPWVAEENLIAQNVIAHNGAGVVMADYGFGMVFSNTLTENSIYANGGLDWNGILYEEGIALFDDANAHILPPVVNNSNSGAGTADGTACPNCIVEIFSDNDDEGKWYEGTVTANGSGNWSFNKGSAFSGANVQATATDAAGNTSEFSSGPPQISHVDPVDAVPGMNDLGVNIFG